MLPPEVCRVEPGGTLGDIESMPFVEALRQFTGAVGLQKYVFRSRIPDTLAGESVRTEHQTHAALGPNFVSAGTEARLYLLPG